MHSAAVEAPDHEYCHTAESDHEVEEMHRLVELHRSKIRPPNSKDAVRAVSDSVPVVQNEADDLPEAQGHDRQVVPSEAKHGDAQQNAEDHGKSSSQNQCRPERKTDPRVQKSIGVGPHCIKGDIAQIEKSGEPDNHIEAHGQHDIDAGQDEDIGRISIQHPGKREQCQEQCDGHAAILQSEQKPLPAIGDISLDKSEPAGDRVCLNTQPHEPEEQDKKSACDTYPNRISKPGKRERQKSKPKADKGDQCPVHRLPPVDMGRAAQQPLGTED
jgi:hypothetical protein